MSIGNIQARFVEEALLPHNAISGSPFGEFMTNDGIKVKLQFRMVMNNQDQYCFEDLDKYCLQKYGIGFNRYESEWYWRLSGYVSDYWHIVRMEKVS